MESQLTGWIRIPYGGVRIYAYVELSILGYSFCKPHVLATRLIAGAPFFSDHVFDGHVVVFFHLTSFSAALVVDGFDFAFATAGQHPAFHCAEDDYLGLFLISEAGKGVVVLFF